MPFNVSTPVPRKSTATLACGTRKYRVAQISKGGTTAVLVRNSTSRGLYLVRVYCVTSLWLPAHLPTSPYWRSTASCLHLRQRRRGPRKSRSHVKHTATLELDGVNAQGEVERKTSRGVRDTLHMFTVKASLLDASGITFYSVRPLATGYSHQHCDGHKHIIMSVPTPVSMHLAVKGLLSESTR